MLTVVTGATGGLGYATAEGLARAGHAVVLTGRNPQKGAEALAKLARILPRAELRFELLDMASLASVAAFANRAASLGPVGVLVNNAGVMALPTRQTTLDGFELQFGTNYLGHFALTGRLLPQLRGGRVVSISSVAHRGGAIAFDDLQGERSYGPMRAYRQSKLAMLMFARELQRRSALRGWGLSSIAAHPGWTATRIVLNGLGTGPLQRLAQAAFSALGQSADDGAQPFLFAALSPDAVPGGYYGPNGIGELRGPPAPSRVMPQAQDAAAASRLWAASETLTDVRYGD